MWFTMEISLEKWSRDAGLKAMDQLILIDELLLYRIIDQITNLGNSWVADYLGDPQKILQHEESDGPFVIITICNDRSLQGCVKSGTGMGRIWKKITDKNDFVFRILTIPSTS